MKLECSECGNDLNRINDIKELSVVPYKFYINPDIFEKEVILICKKCNYFKMLSSWDKLKYNIAMKIIGQRKESKDKE